MKTADLRTKSPDELKQELLTLQKERFNLRFQKANGQLQGTSRVRSARRDIAKIKTVLNELNSGKAPVAKAAPKAKKAAPAKKKKENKE